MADPADKDTGWLLSEMLGSLAPDEKEGDQIGPYRLCELLGEGGFGNVWRAEQSEPVRREVAVKVIKLGMDTVQVLARFNKERQALASLEHPNIATLRDAGVCPSGRPYFAMELVRGGAITAWCETRGVALPERLRLFIRVCEAVQHAHARGILHRDLKPSNILVAEIDERPVPKVIDFGIAKALHGGSLQESRTLTQEDQLIGTPLYMAPEQIEGGQELDARSDVYALGVLLYQLLTDQLPFDTTTLNRCDFTAVKRLIRETIPERPSRQLRRRTGTRAHGIAADLDWIAMRALEKDRERRYATAAELAADVQRFLDQQPVLAGPPSVTYKASRWAKRHRTALTAAGLAAAISGVAVTAIQRRPAPAPGGSAPQAARPIIAAATPLPAAEIAKRTVTNSLGMKFVPVPITGGPTHGKRVLFSIWDTRVQDYEAFAAETKREWPKPEFEQGPTHPAVEVTWYDATAFSAWLTERERRAGALTENDVYRLPSDHEWSCAVGIGEREDAAKTPEEKYEKIEGVFPWGTGWPPPEKGGNYWSDELNPLLAAGKYPQHANSDLLGYRDGFTETSPVGSFAANRFGLFDLDGNVEQWCEDWWDAKDKKRRVLRGPAWTAKSSHRILLSHRDFTFPSMRRGDCGFRVVLAPSAAP